MRKKMGLLALALMLAASAGCGRKELESGKAPEGIVLTVSLPEAEWSGYTDELTKIYLDSHPEIERIDWNLVDRSMYSDLLKVNLVSQNMPDIISVGSQASMETWKDHLAELDERAAEKIPERYLAAGELEGSLYSLPVLIQGKGILYNMEMLRRQDVEGKIPETREEFRILCEALREADIKPIMNHYKETLLTMTSPLFLLPMVYGGELEGWYALADFLDLTLEYGNRNSLTAGGDTARDYYFIEQYAMLNNEGSWLAPVIRRAAPEMEGKTAIGPVPLYDEPERNKLPVEELSLSVTKSSAHQEEAQEFLIWLASSEEARTYLEETMGCLTVSGMEEEGFEGLSPIAAEVKEAILSGRAVWDRSGEIPEEAKNETAELWSRYLTGELDRGTAVPEVCSLWENYRKEYQGGD